MTARYSSTLSRGLSCAPSKAGDFQLSDLERVVLELTEKVASMCKKNTWTRKPLVGRITLTRVIRPSSGFLVADKRETRTATSSGFLVAVIRPSSGGGKEETAADLDSDRLEFSLRANPAETPAAPKGLQKTLADISWTWQLLQSSSPSGD